MHVNTCAAGGWAGKASRMGRNKCYAKGRCMIVKGKGGKREKEGGGDPVLLLRLS